MKLPRPAASAGLPGEETLSWNAAGVPYPKSLPGSRLLDEVRRACGPFEWVSFAYLAWLDAILILFHRNVPHAAGYFALHVAIAAAIAYLTRSAARSPNSVLRFVRHWYPLPLYIFFFEELAGLVHAVFPGWFDRWLIGFDHSLTGVHPAVWLAQFASPALNDFMQFAYMTYFLYLVILPAILYAQRKRRAFWTVMVSTALANYSIYTIAVLFPIESPYYSLAALETHKLAGGYCTAVIDLIERFGRVHGAAFPSAHVAGSMVAMLASWRYRRWLFWVCLPFFASMCVATVYGRYHYVADVLAGLAVGAFGFSAGSLLMSRTAAHLEARDCRTLQWVSFR
jgi:membrane-associated phospholipid phosphatase